MIDDKAEATAEARRPSEYQLVVAGQQRRREGVGSSCGVLGSCAGMEGRGQDGEVITWWSGEGRM